jgi:beta/gamma crystallin
MKMKTPGRFVCLLLIVLAATAAGTIGLIHAQERQMGGVGITVFADPNFRGRSATYQQDVPDLEPLGLNDKTSSVRVGPGEQWELCEHSNYQGRCVVVSGDEPDLRRNSWNDLISSFRKVGGGRGRPWPPTQSNTSIVLFDRANYQGNPASVDGPTPDLFRFNASAQSVMIGRGSWQLCEGINFTGRCVLLNTSVPDLRAYNLLNRVHSLRPIGSGGLPPPPPTNEDWYIVLYDQLSYRGKPTDYRHEEPNLNARVQSVLIGRGVWELCDGRNFTGQCVTLRANAPDLRAYNLLNRVRSVRPVESGGWTPPPPEEDWYIVLFDQTDYRGTPTNYQTEESNLNKRARSVTIGRGIWELCDGRNFSGNCVTLMTNVADLRSVNMYGRIASLRPVNRPQRQRRR